MTLEQLKKTYDEEMKRSMKPVVEDIPWAQKAAYAEWMAQTYFYVSHSTRIIGLSGSLFKRDRNELHVRFMEHVAEEKGHEKVMLLDMKALGYKIDDFRPSANALALYQTQYYWIQNVNPLSVYGYFLYLEGLSIECGGGIYKQLEAAHPANACKYLKLHVEEDIGHVQKHFDVLKVATPDELRLIDENLRLTGQLYRQMTKDIISAAAGQKKKAA